MKLEDTKASAASPFMHLKGTDAIAYLPKNNTKQNKKPDCCCYYLRTESASLRKIQLPFGINPSEQNKYEQSNEEMLSTESNSVPIKFTSQTDTENR